jgi:hypothetical protein
MLDDTIDVRTIEVYVEYDPGIVTSLSGGGGQLFDDLGVFIFEDFDDETPGQWFGAAVVMDAYSWVTGPGELYVWSLSGAADGTSPVTTVEVLLYDPDAALIADVTLDPTTVSVGDPLVGVPGDAPPPRDARLELWPNPFNPRTEVVAAVPVDGWCRVEVLDARGRRVDVLWEGSASGVLRLPWDGRDAAGRNLASGIYLFRMTGPEDTWATARGALLR